MRAFRRVTRYTRPATAAIVIAVTLAWPAAAADPRQTGTTIRATTSGDRLHQPGVRSRGRVTVERVARPGVPDETATDRDRPDRLPEVENGSAGVLLPEAPGPVVATVSDTSAPDADPMSSICCGPDQEPTQLAIAGPDHDAWIHDGTIYIAHRDLTGGLALGVGDLFGLPAETQRSDPRMFFDAAHARWVAAEVSWDCVSDGPATFGYGYLDFAFSDGPDPTKGWSSYYYTYVDYIPAHIGLGNARDSFVITTSVQAMIDSDCTREPNHGNEVLWFDWAGVDADPDAALTYWQYAAGVDWYRMLVPALAFPASDPEAHLVGVSGHPGDTNGLNHLTVNVGTGIIHAEHLTDLGVLRGLVDPPPIIQGDELSTPVRIEPVEVTSAAWSDDRLVFSTNDRCQPVGDDTERACARIVELSSVTSPASVAQDFLVGLANLDTYSPALALTQNGDLLVSSITSSTTALPHETIFRQAPGDGANTISDPTTLAQVSDWFAGGYASDYHQISPDPLVPDGALAIGQVSDYLLINLSTAVGATYVPIEPHRALDTRVGVGLSGAFVANTPRTLTIAGAGGGIPAEAIAVTANLTVTGQTAAGYVSLGPIKTATPSSSTINFPLGDTRANNVTVSLDANGGLSAVYKAASTKKAHLVLDITGYFLAGSGGATYVPVDSARILDSRDGTGLAGKFVAGISRTLQVTGSAGVPSGALAITGNLTVTNQTKPGFVSLTPAAEATPTTSTLNVPVGDNRANGVTVPLSNTGTLAAIYMAASGGQADLILDVTGYYESGNGGLQFFPLNPARIMDTRSAALTQLFGAFSTSAPRALVTGGHFGVPADAQAVTGNLAVVGQTAAGFVAITKDPTATPAVSTLNFPIGDTRANGVTVPLNATNDMALVYKAAAGAKTHLILDLTGYFR